jgi:hypothetical protein
MVSELRLRGMRAAQAAAGRNREAAVASLGSAAVKRAILGVGLAAGAALLGGCVVYEPVPAGYSQPASFDRSWNAAVGAMREQGVTITQEDRGAGIVRGTRGGINVTGSVRPQADGSVRVQFDTTGATGADPTLIDRITRSYQAFMGR